MSEVDIKYRIPLTGEYNKSVYRCLECNLNLSGNASSAKHGHFENHITGFSDSEMGEVFGWECPECFTKWYCHCRNNIRPGMFYDKFIVSIEKGLNIHYS